MFFDRVFGCVCAVVFVLFCFSTSALGAGSPASSVVATTELAPNALIKSMTDEAMRLITEAAVLPSGELKDQKKLMGEIETKIGPHFDFVHITRLATGPNWRKATLEQQKSLTKEFRALLIFTYSKMLLLSHGSVINQKLLRMVTGDTEATVRLEVKDPRAEKLVVDIVLEKTSAGWKIYNVTVGGVSLVTTYRNSFASQIEKSGIDGLIKTLAEKNQQLKK